MSLVLLADGFEDAILGVVTRKCLPDVVCYDYEKCIQVLVMRDGMTFEEASEYMSFNVTDSFNGEGTPAFLFKPTDGETVLEFVNIWADNQ